MNSKIIFKVLNYVGSRLTVTHLVDLCNFSLVFIDEFLFSGHDEWLISTSYDVNATFFRLFLAMTIYPLVV